MLTAAKPSVVSSASLLQGQDHIDLFPSSLRSPVGGEGDYKELLSLGDGPFGSRRTLVWFITSLPQNYNCQRLKVPHFE
ncbi:hypothetical protein chiPu_0009552 [Chiloscyllium punctatum]|uniref:Uncharacterized protein n=1 Tax=Chiloscyllium punctatum TaxID=137246 RepID=A0A401SL34_CHIPU|nr:hypothetical protein [Chiloscyllium punctatum]